MSFNGVAFPPCRASFCTTFITYGDSGESRRTATVFGACKGMLSVETFVPNKSFLDSIEFDGDHWIATKLR